MILTGVLENGSWENKVTILKYQKKETEQGVVATVCLDDTVS